METINQVEKNNIKNDRLLGYLNLAYANYYIEVGFFDIALEKALESYKQLSAINDKKSLRLIRSTIAKIDRQNSNIDKAINEYQKLIQELSTKNISIELGGYYLDIANAYMYLKDDNFKKAEKYLDLALITFKELNNKTGEGMAYLKYARFYKLLLFKSGNNFFLKKQKIL
ncbi:hypothetical protein [Polaribacter sp. R77954]|uniref:hypothetical protein n=1 Tax=Polaribacter sp. R77954 TaxID=3093870 RepID=UPI0037CAE2A7